MYIKVFHILDLEFLSNQEKHILVKGSFLHLLPPLKSGRLKMDCYKYFDILNLFLVQVTGLLTIEFLFKDGDLSFEEAETMPGVHRFVTTTITILTSISPSTGIAEPLRRLPARASLGATW